MKKFIFIFLLFALNIQGFSQTIDTYGIKLGLALSNHKWEYNTSPSFNLNWDNNYGITARVFADISFLSFLNMEGEIGYVPKGVKYKIPITTITQPDGTGEYVNVNNKLNYLSISLLAKYKYHLGLFTPYIILGPEFNYLLSKTIDKGFAIVYDQFRKNLWGFTVGVGSEIKLLPINLLIEYRYSRDLTNSYELSTIDIKNYSHTFLIGVCL